MFVHTGDYVEQRRDDAMRSAYYTFTPLPLAKGTFHTIDDGLAVLLTKTHRSLGVLEGITASTTIRDTLADLTLLRESCFSKMIDYPDPDIRSMLAEQGTGKLNSDIQNIMSAYHYALETPTKKLSYNDLINHALTGNDYRRKVALRDKPLFLTYSTSNYRQYNPTDPDSIRPALIDIEHYIASSRADVLIKTAMCHYQFEMIHPYECYNGIVGRILLYHILNDAKLNGARFCSISASLYRHKAEYFDRLASTQKNGNYTAWINFFVQIIDEAAQQGIEFIQYYDTTTRQDEENILLQRHNRTDCILDVYRHFKKNIISSIRYTSEQVGLSFNTVSSSINLLQSLGILVQTAQSSRNRLFAHAGLMERLMSSK
ncbi:MAG: Fic family protein [Oscillospiraceae bacterium]|nr:Fic family protein [Oscillospiraceae bacterium]